MHDEAFASRRWPGGQHVVLPAGEASFCGHGKHVPPETGLYDELPQRTHPVRVDNDSIPALHGTHDALLLDRYHPAGQRTHPNRVDNDSIPALHGTHDALLLLRYQPAGQRTHFVKSQLGIIPGPQAQVPDPSHHKLGRPRGPPTKKSSAMENV